MVMWVIWKVVSTYGSTWIQKTAEHKGSRARKYPRIERFVCCVIDYKGFSEWMSCKGLHHYPVKMYRGNVHILYIPS